MPYSRPAAVAGLFYPGSETELKNCLDEFLHQAKSRITQLPEQPIKAIIAPHAGYIYSGPVAASVYALLKNSNRQYRKVVLLGPAHRVAFEGIAVPTVDEFESPLGTIKLDLNLIQKIKNFDFVTESDLAHKDEHCLEVQLPFLQKVLGEFLLTPLLVGHCDAEQVSQILETIWDLQDTLIVVSSDLSHYHDYQTAKQIDQGTSDAIVSLHPEQIGYDQACGKIPVQGVLLSAKRHQLNVELVDLRNSGDTAGSKDRVVGYGAYVIA